MVRQTERGPKPPSGRLLTRFHSHRGTMQHVPRDVLQELQHQGESEKETRVGKGSRANRRRLGRLGGDSTPSKTTFTFASQDSQYSTSSSPTPSLSEVEGHPRHSGSEIPRRRSGRRSEAHTPTQASSAIPPQIGSTAGSRKTSSPSWPPSAKTLPPQLMGECAGSHANVLTSKLYDHSAVRSDVAPAPRPSRVQAYLQDTSPSMKSPSTTSIRPTTPPSGDSTPEISTPSFSSGESYASSFAHLLRDNRADRRLFQKKSLPLQHRKKAASPVKRPPSIRSAPSYKPKIVEDTGAIEVSTSSPSIVPPLPPMPPSTPLSSTSLRTLVRKDHSSQSQSQSHSESSRETSLSPPPTTIRRGRARSPPRHINISSAPYPVYRETSPELQAQRRNSSQDRKYVTPITSSLRPFPSPRPFPKQRDRRPTPPERDPHTPFDRTPSHGDHYFRMFGPETVYEKLYSKSSLPQQTQKVEGLQRMDEPEPSTPAPKRSAETPLNPKRHHMRHSIFNMFHVAARNDHVLEEADDRVGDMWSPVQSPADVKGGTPSSTRTSRKSTPDFLASYFTKQRRHNQSSDNTPSMSAFALATNWEDVVAESQSYGHIQQDSAPMSPLSMPQHPVRPRPKRTDEKMDVAKTVHQLPTIAIGTEIPFGPAVGPQPMIKPGASEQHSKRSLTGPDTSSWLPSEMRRINTPPVESVDLAGNRAGELKNFSFDTRNMPTEQSSVASDSPVRSRIKRRKPILPKMSLSFLFQKVSMPKLKRKESQMMEEPQKVEDPFAITGFEQTPFSQRYGDARRTKMHRIRSYLDETLEDSENDEGMALFEFDVPDHLPNSPLCPLSPKHSSGGKAICPIHRRKKTLVGSSNGKMVSRQVKQGPRIVFESEQQADANLKSNMDGLTR